MNSPLISVCLPLYNSGSYVQATIDCILTQTHTNWELILVDDCSTDGTAATISAVVARLADPRIRFSVNPIREGMVGNWNRATGAATGEFIKLIGQDDLLAPDCLEAQCEIMQQYPSVTVVACARRVVSPSGKPLMVRRCFPREGVYAGPETIRKCLRNGTNIIGEPVSVLFRRSTFGTDNLFERTILYCTDLDLWLRFLTRGDLYYMAEPKSSYRIHQGAATRSLEHEVLKDFLRVVDRMVAAGYFETTKWQRRWLMLKVRILAIGRSTIYLVLARK